MKDLKTYSHDYYMSHHESIRAYQKKYYEKNKAKMCKKYAHHRQAWDAKNRKYLNEVARLSKIIRTTEWQFGGYEAMLKKEYLKDLRARGLIQS